MLLEHLPALAKTKIVLASASPRRHELLQLLGLKPEVIPSKFEENLSKDLFSKAAEYAVATAKGKALDVTQLLATQGKAVDLIIGADTIVEHDSEILEKPANADDAARMLGKLSGNKHLVHTGMVLVVPSSNPGVEGPLMSSASVTTAVQFDELSNDTISAYIASGHPFGKAGSYGIQGPAATFVKHIDGDFFNVMGFPLNAFANEVSDLIAAGHLKLMS
ncbi:hypothetical protein WJX74_003378 [Apatococcus lobatus]|uniref:Uncharacterized protein n=1 Tax=Apatococcus lobatus TaxID=904363 RepID=A0AAW1QXR0_9CHLO